jgi:hypothetical protein
MMYGRDEPIRDYDEGDSDSRLDARQKVAGVPAKLDRLEKALMLLAEQVERAEEKLGPALRPERPHPVNGEIGTADRSDESELAARIDGMGFRAQTFGRRLGDLLDRVDL